MLSGLDIERIKEELQPLFSDVKNTLNTLPKSSIKKIQRGYFAGAGQYSGNPNITISTVNVAKSILIIDRNARNGETGTTTGYGRIQLTSSHITVDIQPVPSGGAIAEPFYWQVIEFN